MKKLLLLLLLASGSASAQTQVSKNANNVISNGPIAIGSGNTLSGAGTFDFHLGTVVLPTAISIPSAVGQTGLYLKSDGTAWLPAAGGGGGGSGTVTTIPDGSTNGVTWTVATRTTTPTFTFTLGAITPTSVNGITFIGTNATSMTFPLLSATLARASVFDIRDYGAIGNDSTDNTTAIQNAVNAASSAGGGSVLIPPGIFRTGQIALKNSVRIFGVGNASVLKLKNSGNNYILANIDGTQYVDDVIIEDLTIDGNKANNTSGGGIDFIGRRDVARNNYIFNTVETGIILGPATNGTSNVPDAGNYLIYGNTIINASKSNASEYGGIAITHGTRIIVAHNIVQSTDGFQTYGISIETNTGNSGSLIEIANNVVIGGRIFADFANSSSAGTQVTIVGNLVDARGSASPLQSFGAPVFLRNIDGLKVSNNHLIGHSDGPYGGINTLATITNFEISDNLIEASLPVSGSSYGIYFENLSSIASNGLISGNQIVGIEGAISFGIFQNDAAGFTNVNARGNNFVNVTTPYFLATTGISVTDFFQFTGAAGSTKSYALPNVSTTILTANDTTTGTGALVRANMPTLILPIIGIATGTSLNLSAAPWSDLLSVNGRIGMPESQVLAWRYTDGTDIADTMGVRVDANTGYLVGRVRVGGTVTESFRSVAGGNFTIPGVYIAGSGPTTLNDSLGKVLSAALNTVAVAQGGLGTATGPTSGQIPVGNAGGTAYAAVSMSADATLASTGALTLATVNGNVGTWGSATAAPQITINAKGLITAAGNVTVTPAVGSITGLGTGIGAALAINVGTAGSLVVNGGALGTPSSGTLTSATGLPISTGVSGLATGIAAWLAAPSSANLITALTDETGTGAAMFNISPAVTTSITTGSTTFAFLNTTATTVNAWGATTTLNLGASATMVLNFGGSTTASEFRFLEPSGSGTNYTSIKVGAQSANIAYTLPPTIGAPGTFLNDVLGNGTLSWGNPSGSGTVGSGTTNTMAKYTGSTTVGNSALTDDGTTLTYTGTGGLSTDASATGAYRVTGITSGAFVFTGVDAMGQTVTLSLAAQTVGNATATLPDLAGTSKNILVSLGAAAIASGKTLTVSNTLAFAGTDSTVMTFPSTSATIARTDAANTFTGVQTMTSAALTMPVIATSMTLANGTSPTTGSVAVMAFDTDAWGSGRGAIQINDGTANTYVVAALASSTPGDGKVPTWHTGGTVTWDTVSGGSGVTSVATTAGITGGTITSTGTLSLDLTYSPTWTGIHTWTPAARSSGVAPYYKINTPTDTGITAATEGIGYQHATGTRTWATTGTVTLQRENYFAGPTYASAGASQTFTDVFTMYLDKPIAGTNAIFTRGHTLGIVDSTSASSSITGGFVIATALGTTATSIGMGNGNINAGGNGTFGGTLSVTGHVTLEGVTSTGATGTALLVFATSPTITTQVVAGGLTASGSGSNNYSGSTGTFLTSSGANTISGPLTITPTARATGVASFVTVTTPADTNMTASTESIGVSVTAATRQWATGALTTQREVVFGAPTFGFVGASTLTNAINVDIADPVAGTNATFTNTYGLRVNNEKITGTLTANTGVNLIGPLVDSVDGTTPLNNVVETTAAGTAYTLTTSYAALDFGTTDPVIVLPNAGTYIVTAWVQTTLASATITTQTVSFKMRRTNNTAADVGDVSSNPLPVSTAASPLGPSVIMLVTKYTTTNTNDSLTIQGLISAATGAGSVNATAAHIVAIREY